MLKRTGSSVGEIESSLGAIDPEKRKRSETKLPRTVGIIFQALVDDNFIYDLFAVDIDSCDAEVGSIGPAVRFRCPSTAYMTAVCVVNSSVYIFEGYNAYSPPPLREMTKSAYKLALPSSQFLLSPVVTSVQDFLEEVVADGGLATSIASMYHGKGDPVALPTPDGKKIIVFSNSFPYNGSHEAFEVLTLDDGSWETLPPLPCPFSCCCNESSSVLSESCRHRNYDKFVEVVACSFTSRSRFLLQMPFGAFSLDLDSTRMTIYCGKIRIWGEEKKWTILSTPPPIVPTTKNNMDNLDRCYIETFKDRYALRPALIPDWRDGGCFFKAAFQVYDHGDEGFYRKEATKNYFGQYMRPLTAVDPSYFERQSLLSILPLRPIEEEEEEVLNTCVLQLDKGPPYQFIFFIDVCRTKLNSPGLKYPLKTTVSKTVRLSTCHSLDILDMTTFSV